MVLEGFHVGHIPAAMMLGAEERLLHFCPAGVHGMGFDGGRKPEAPSHVHTNHCNDWLDHHFADNLARHKADVLHQAP